MQIFVSPVADQIAGGLIQVVAIPGCYDHNCAEGYFIITYDLSHDAHPRITGTRVELARPHGMREVTIDDELGQKIIAGYHAMVELRGLLPGL